MEIQNEDRGSTTSNMLESYEPPLLPAGVQNQNARTQTNFNLKIDIPKPAAGAVPSVILSQTKP
jgi:hypothetical protein